MKDIIKKRWDRYKQTLYMFSIIFTFGVFYATFFMFISDTRFHSLIKSESRFILFIFVGRFFIEMIGAVLEFRQKSKKEKDEMTIAQKIVYDIITDPKKGNEPLDEMEFVYQHRKEIDEDKEITRKIDAANEEARKHHEGE